MNNQMFVFKKYLVSSIIIAIVDYLIFWISGFLLTTTLPRILIARVFAIIIQFVLVNFTVFQCKLPVNRSFPLFVLLVLANAFLVSQIIQLSLLSNIPEIAAKIIAEAALYLPNYFISKNLIFKPELEKMSTNNVHAASPRS